MNNDKTYFVGDDYAICFESWWREEIVGAELFVVNEEQEVVYRASVPPTVVEQCSGDKTSLFCFPHIPNAEPAEYLYSLTAVLTTPNGKTVNRVTLIPSAKLTIKEKLT